MKSLKYTKLPEIMMLRFNLLPEQFRNQFVFAQRINRSARYVRIFIGLLGIFSLFLLFSLASLYHQQNQLLDQLSTIKQSKDTQTITRLEKQIRAFNQELTDILHLSHGKDWSLLLIELATLTPQQISLADLSIQTTKAATQALMRGKALKRQDLIDYEKALRSSPYITSVLSPLSNYEQDENLTFQVTLTLTMQKLTEYEDIK